MAGTASRLRRRLIVLAFFLRYGCLATAGQVWFEVKPDRLVIHDGGRAIPVALRAPEFAIGEANPVGGSLPIAMKGRLPAGETLEVAYAPIALDGKTAVDVTLLLTWSEQESVLRKRARFRLVGPGGSRVLKEVILDRVDTEGLAVWTHGSGAPGENSPVLLDGPQSHPVFLPGLFLGIEYPVASTRRDAGKIVLAHRPGSTMRPVQWHESRTAVYGVTRPREEVESFRSYVSAHRPRPRGLHVNYNSWWTSPMSYTEHDVVGLMRLFDERLARPYGVALDTFTVDAGWSHATSLWEVDPKRLPAGLEPLRDAARRMHSNLGLWISPGSFYPFALDGEWARSQGFETLNLPNGGDPKSAIRLLCLGGPRYAERFRSRLAEMAARYDIRQLKLDGYQALCPEADHGHEPGALSSEAIAEGLIRAVAAARQASPGVWAEATCFGYNPSPWWLWHVNSVIGTFGDDAPVGRVPAPVYRESYTTARDYFNLQGAALLPLPVDAQEVLGLVHQSPDPFTNDGVMAVLRGHGFLPLYVNPKFMNDARWEALARLIRWARANEGLLGRTVPLLPASWQAGKVPHFTDAGTMPREPYGYAHVRGDVGLIALRNPWVAPQTYTLSLDARLGFSTAAAGLSAVSIYPEPRSYGEGLRSGSRLDVRLAPYETVVLSVRARPEGGPIPEASPTVRPPVKVDMCECRLQRVAFQGERKGLGPDWTCLLGDVTSAVHLKLHARIDVNAPGADLLVLGEGKASPTAPVGRVKVNGREIRPETASSAAGWSATLLPAHDHWTFQRVPLASGGNEVALDEFVGDDCDRISVWVWATKPGGSASGPDGLPQPERISLGGAVLLAPADLAALSKDAATADRPIERIDGAFLDTLEPVSVTQGWGTLQKNRSVWGKPMVIAGQRFLRGLGTHAPSRITFNLDGKYRRFQTWAGADGATYPTTTFEVWVDGVKRWETGLMTRETPPAWVDLDVTGARRLELVVGSGGDLGGDHADWAEARLLR
jgi:NPCBM/NEW2 domain